ncbi:MAG: alpha/beta fold hydrolase [Ignavibacteria bacterium]|nr:alpha/beta fold hydrolase [Ignavibacteria bacterium]
MVIEPVKSSLLHKVLPAGGGEKGGSPALLLLHGRGTNEDDLLGLAQYLDPRFFIISARAPFRFPYGGFTWYQIVEVGTPVGSEFDESYQRLTQLIDDIRQNYPIDPQRIFILGFSMGSVMSFALSLTHPEAVRGVVAHSGYIPENTSLRFQWDKLAGLSLFVAHGVHDLVIPISHARRAQELLSATKAHLTYKEYPIPHTMSEESLSDLSTWLQNRLDVAADIK